MRIRNCFLYFLWVKICQKQICVSRKKLTRHLVLDGLGFDLQNGDCCRFAEKSRQEGFETKNKTFFML